MLRKHMVSWARKRATQTQALIGAVARTKAPPRAPSAPRPHRVLNLDYCNANMIHDHRSCTAHTAARALAILDAHGHGSGVAGCTIATRPLAQARPRGPRHYTAPPAALESNCLSATRHRLRISRRSGALPTGASLRGQQESDGEPLRRGQGRRDAVLAPRSVSCAPCAALHGGLVRYHARPRSRRGWGHRKSIAMPL